MADIKLNITGDASDAVAAMSQTADATDRLHKQATAMGDAQRKQSDEFWKSVAAGAVAGAAALAAFLASSVKAFMEADKAQRQLTRAAGEYSEALSAQASALQDLYAVDDDVIKQSQVLLTQWGGVGAATKENTEAILNYAAATGQDAVGATQDLIRNVESGGKGMAKLGIHFDATGEKSEDLRRLTAALAEKYGGAAGADASSLHGQVSKVGNAFSDLQEDIGGMIASFNTQYDITGKLTEALRGLQTLLGGGDQNTANARNDEYLATLEALNGRIERRGELAKQAADFETVGATQAAEAIRFLSAENERGIAIIRAGLEERRKAIAGGVLPAMEVGGTNAGGREDAKEAARAAKAAAKEESDVRKAMATADAQDAKDFQKAELEAQDEYAKESIKIEKERLAEIQKSQEEVNKWLAAIDKEEAAAALKTQKEEAKVEEHALKDQNERLEKKAKQAQAAGDAIGAAFVNALASQLQKLAAGEEFDAAIFIGDILAAAVGIAGTVIGTAFGAPAVGAAIGNLAAMGVRAGAGALSTNNRKLKAGSSAYQTMHDGGWVDAPRHHSGSWIGDDERRAILQTGERVLSRAEVHHAGGPAAVDNMARGGGGLTLNVHAIDAKSMADTFSGSGGDGLKQALRRGHGALPALLGRSPR